MLTRTFQIASGVGPWREKELWEQGIRCWDDFPQEGTVAVSTKLDATLRQRLSEARRALEQKELATLATLIPPREHWRLYPQFSSEVAFFDIETDGEPGRQSPTLVGLFDAQGPRVFVSGRDLDEVPEALARSKIWVTFNGSCFDVPVLQAWFKQFPKPLVHLDLRFVCRRVQLTGGLKEIERKLGLARPGHLEGLGGWDAVLLWRAFREKGDLGALQRLAEYNLYDTVHLKSLLDVVFNRAVESLGWPAPRLPVFEPGPLAAEVNRLALSVSSSFSSPAASSEQAFASRR